MAKKKKDKSASSGGKVSLPKPRDSVDESATPEPATPEPANKKGEKKNQANTFITTMSAEALKEYEQIEAIAPERLLARLWNVVDSNNNGVIEMHEIAYSGVEAILEGWEGLDANKDGR